MTIQPNYLKLYAGLVSAAVFVVALGTVINRLTEGHWMDPLVALRWALVFLVLPAFLLFAPKRIEWSDIDFFIHPRLGKPRTFRWSKLVSYGTGEGKAVFVIRFAGHPPFRMLTWAFNADSWRAFEAFLATTFPAERL